MLLARGGTRGHKCARSRACQHTRAGASGEPTMPAYKAGQEIDAYCTKCKMDLLHKIVAVVDGKPVKVECRTCYTTHLYRAPRAPRPSAATGAGPAATASSAGSSS